MSSNEQPAHPARDLAARIYVELIGRAFRGTDSAEQFKPDPANMAALCFGLAEAFLVKAEELRKAGPAKLSHYQAQDADLVDWLK